MRTLFLALLLFPFSPRAAESAAPFPLWDGKESIEAYAKKINLPPARSFDLGGGVTLDLVLIPAGQFMMGSPKPPEPTITYEAAYFMIGAGVLLGTHLMLLLAKYWFHRRKISFSLRWLFWLMMACALFVGGIVRSYMAQQQELKYDAAWEDYTSLPANEKPARRVTIERPFYMGKYTVTQAQYQKVMGKNPSKLFKGPQLPVTNVLAAGTGDFCSKFEAKLKGNLTDGMQIDLPTTEQWEFACRAGTATAFNTGETISTGDANFDGDLAPQVMTKEIAPAPVGSFKPNAFGLYDLHGNIWQICHSSSEISGTVIRGGSFCRDASECRSASFIVVGGNSPYESDTGFRIILRLP